MPDESPLNTFDLSVVLPINDASPPFIFFQIFFNCNGINFSSDQLNNADDALEWAQDELASFGTWTVVNNTLYLSESLCGVGSINLIVSTLEQGDVDGAGSMDIDDSSPVAIDRILGGSFVDVSLNHARATDSFWKNEISQIRYKYADAYTDNINGMYHVKPAGGGDGYNMLASEVTALGKDIATYLGGVGNVTYGYDFFDGEFTVYVPQLGITEAILAVNLDSLLLQVVGTNPVNIAGISTTAMFAEWAFYISKLATAGVTVTSIQLGVEEGIALKQLITHSADDVKNISVVAINYFRANYPSLKLYSDAYEVNDESERLNNYNPTLATMDIDGARQYFQFQDTLNTYEKNRDRIYELGGVLTKFRQVFGVNRKVRFQQSVVKPGNPFEEKVGEGLIQMEFWMHVIKQNIQFGGMIDYLTGGYPPHRLMTKTNVIFPLLRFAQLGSGMFINNGMIEVDFDNDNLEVLGCKKGTGSELYIINTSEDFQSETISLNGTLVAYTLEAWYGGLTEDEASHYTASGNAGTSALLYPHSFTKISIV